jgi:hypothetical protein
MTRTLSALATLLAFVPCTGMAQQTLSRVLSSEIAISRERAEIKLELDNGRNVTLATDDRSGNRRPRSRSWCRTDAAHGDSFRG